MPFHSIPLYPTFQSLLCRLWGSLCKYKQIYLQFLINASPFTQKVDYHIPDISLSISMHREFPHLFLSCTVCQHVDYQHLFNYPYLMDLQVVSNLLLLQAMPRQLTLYGRTPLHSSVTLSQSMFLEEVPELVTTKPGPLSFGTAMGLGFYATSPSHSLGPWERFTPQDSWRNWYTVCMTHGT